MFGNVFQSKSVWLSGATGFKASLMDEWLLSLGARVHGYSLAPDTSPALFDQLGLAKRIESEIADIRDPGRVRQSIKATQPDFVFHLAAQPLVRLSYDQPLETYATNVMGTAHVLEALRGLKKPCAAALITTDKCYENREWLHGYREEDPLGGHDPYSSSKAAAEIAIAAWRRSFFKNHPVKIASARAGNVIGGGDWAKDRIVPDCVRALQKKRLIAVRNPNATRPWQHVLEPLSGYLWLAACLSQPLAAPKRYVSPKSDEGGSEGGSTLNPQLATAFNFGPAHEANHTVAELVAEVLKHWPGRWEDQSDPKAVHEAGLLQLSTDKAHALLGWQPIWSFPATVERTVAWYRETAADPHSARALTSRQIEQYQTDAAHARVAWATNSNE
jgi:CDP-glucose 4,6-dehydratase